MSEESTRARLDWLREHFRPEGARDVSVVYQFELTGSRLERFWVQVGDGQLALGAGVAPEADVHFRLEAKDYEEVLAGRQNAELLFMAGRVEFSGEPRLAARIQSLFRASRP